jgi:hypothetical protein
LLADTAEPTLSGTFPALPAMGAFSALDDSGTAQIESHQIGTG